MGSLSSIIQLPHVTVPPRTALSIAEARGEDLSTAKPVQAVTRITHLRDDVRTRQRRQGETGDGERSQESARSRDLVTLARPVWQQPGNPQRGAGLVADPFLVQILGQNLNASAGALSEHRDGPALGSDAYRRAGAEPEPYPEEPAIFRVAV